MIWNFVVQLIIAAVFFVIGELLRPPPDFEDAQATPFEEVNLPQTDPSKRQPIIWGLVDLRSPHVMDVTEYNTIAIRKKVKKNAFSSKKITIGHRYLMGMQAGICAPGATLRAVYMDDREIWTGVAAPVNDGVPFSVNLPEFYGGREFGGGIIGSFRYYGGGVNQNQSAYLASFQTPFSPNYRWTSYLQLENVELGENPNIRNLAVQVQRYPDPLGLGGQNMIGVDLNPMSILYEILLDQDWGFALEAADVNTASLTSFAATLFTEGNGMSIKWVNEQTIDRLVEQITKQTGCVLRYNPTTGQWEVKPLRFDYTVGSLPVFDQSAITELSNFSRSNWDETSNQILINFKQRGEAGLDPPPPAQAQDRSNIIRQGRVKSQSLTLPGCYDADTAASIAARELFEVGVPLSKATFTVNRTAYQLLPGDPFVFAWDELGITQIVMRVAEIGFGDDELQTIAIGAVEDVFALRSAIFSAPPPSLFTPISGPPVDIPASDQYAGDQPYWLNRQGGEFTNTPGEAHQVFSAAAKPQGDALDYTVQQRINGSGDAFTPENIADHNPKGELQVALLESAGGNDDTIAALIVENVTLSQIIDTNAVSGSIIKQNYQNLGLIVPTSGEPEFFAYEDAAVAGTVVTLTNVRRGLFDTLPVDALAGDAVFFLTGAEIDGVGSTETEFGSTSVVDVRLVNRNNQGEATPATTLVVTFRDRVNRPYPPAGFTVNNDRYPGAPLPLDTDVEFRWNHRDRLDNDFLFHDEASQDQNSSPGGNGGAGEEGFEYVLRIYDDILNNLERTVRASGGDDTFTTNTNSGVFYDYTLAKQQADGGPFARLRAELQTVDTATGTVTSVLDVIRVFQVIIPLNFRTRGFTYYAGVQEQVGVIYPLTEQGFPKEATVGGSGNATLAGTAVGDSGPLPDMLSDAAVFMGYNNGAGFVGAITMPDDSNFDQINNNGWVHSFMVKCVRDGETDRRNILIKDDAAAAPVVNWQFGTHLDGGVDGKLTWYWQGFASTQPSTGLSSARRQLDDGRWHRVSLVKTAGTHTTCAVIIDGAMAWRTSTSSAIGTNANMSVGGFSGHSGWTAQKMMLAQLVGDNDGMTMQNVMRAHIHAQRWTPYVSLMPHFLDWAWVRGGGYLSGQGQQMFDWSTAERNTTANDFSPNINSATAPLNAMNIGNSGGIDAAWHDSPILDGNPGNRAMDLGGNGIRMGNDIVFAKNTQGPKEYCSFAVFQPDSLPATINIRFFSFEDVVLVGGEVNQGELYCAWVDDAGFIRISIETSNGNYRVQRTNAQCIFPGVGVWQQAWVINRDTTGWEVWVNGEQFSLDTAFATAGTVPAVDTFLNDRNEGGSLNANLYHNVFQSRPSSDTPPGGTTNFDYPGLWAEAGEGIAQLPTADEIRLVYAISLGGFPTMLDVLLDYAPTHVWQVLDNTAVDLRGVLTSLTATGTFPTDEELPLPAHDDTMPARFNGGERLRYTDAAFKGTGAIGEFGAVVIGQIQDDSVDQTFFANHRADDANNSTNFCIYYDQGGNGIYLRGSATIGNNGIMSRTRGGVFCAAFSQLPAANAIKFFDEGSVKYVTGFGYSAPADTMGECSIGTRGNVTEQLDGSAHYVALWDREGPERALRRAQLAYHGYDGALLEIHTHIDTAAGADEGGTGFIYPLADFDQSASGAENHVRNDPAIQNLTLTGTQTRVRSGAIVNGIPAYSSYASGSYLSGTFNATTGYPFTIGARLRVDSGTEAWVGISQAGDTDTFLAVGIVSGVPTLRLGLNSTPVDESGAGSITAGTFADVAVTFVNDTTRRLYLNGELDSTFSTSRNVDATVLANADTVFVNRIVGPNTDTDGSYQLLWGVAKALTNEHHRVIFREGMHKGWQNMTAADGAIAQWLLDEPSEFMPSTPIFRDQYNPAYNAQPSSTGVTLDAAGLLPAAPGLAVDLDGANGGIDTNWTGYPVGTADRAFECWLEGGFEGTVCSMGANVDAQAVVVSVDSSGDVSVHIRGAGNERIWTTALNTGSENHLWVELDGDSLHDFRVIINGIEQTTIGTPGTDTTLATVATLDMFIGEDVTDVGKADGSGRIYGVTVYDAPIAVPRVAIHNSVGRARFTAVDA